MRRLCSTQRRWSNVGDSRYARLRGKRSAYATMNSQSLCSKSDPAAHHRYPLKSYPPVHPCTRTRVVPAIPGLAAGFAAGPAPPPPSLIDIGLTRPMGLACVESQEKCSAHEAQSSPGHSQWNLITARRPGRLLTEASFSQTCATHYLENTKNWETMRAERAQRA